MSPPSGLRRVARLVARPPAWRREVRSPRRPSGAGLRAKSAHGHPASQVDSRQRPHRTASWPFKAYIWRARRSMRAKAG
eukprot:350480-Prymnesium_polylepis.1